MSLSKQLIPQGQRLLIIAKDSSLTLVNKSDATDFDLTGRLDIQ